MFVVMIVGAVIGYSQSMDEIQEALEKSMVKFKDENDPNYENMKPDEKAVTDAWNTIQGDVSFWIWYWIDLVSWSIMALFGHFFYIF